MQCAILQTREYRVCLIIGNYIQLLHSHFQPSAVYLQLNGSHIVSNIHRIFKIFHAFIHVCKHIIASFTSLNGTRNENWLSTEWMRDSIWMKRRKKNDDRNHKFVWKHKWHFRVKIIYGEVCSIMRFVLIAIRTQEHTYFFKEKVDKSAFYAKRNVLCVSRCMFCWFCTQAIAKSKVLGLDKCDDFHWLWIRLSFFSYSHLQFQLYTYLSRIHCVGQMRRGWVRVIGECELYELETTVALRSIAFQCGWWMCLCSRSYKCTQ